MIYNGMPFIESTVLTKGTKAVPKRRNRTKRIQKKWDKKYGFNYIPIPDPNVYIFEGRCIGHPKTLRKIIKSINNK